MFHVPAHKNVQHPAGQVNVGDIGHTEVGVSLPFARATRPTQHFTHYVDCVVREQVLTTGSAKGAYREVIERTWFEVGDDAYKFQKYQTARRGISNVGLVVYPPESQRKVVIYA